MKERRLPSSVTFRESLSHGTERAEAIPAAFFKRFRHARVNNHSDIRRALSPQGRGVPEVTFARARARTIDDPRGPRQTPSSGGHLRGAGSPIRAGHRAPLGIHRNATANSTYGPCASDM